MKMLWEDPLADWTSSRLGAMKLNVGLPTRVNRKVMKGLATKRTAVGQQRLLSARAAERTTVDPCDNSNDSGLGFDHHLEVQLAARSTLRFADQEASWANEHSEVKRKKLEIKLESDDANDNFSFPETMSRREKRGEGTERIVPRNGDTLGHVGSTGTVVPRSETRPHAIASRRSGGTSLSTNLVGMSRNNKTHLQILCQPEQQHRARYQTEGSRGAVKDRSGNGFPIVKLVGYNKPATLQIFIGTDVGRIAPHMFYQACRVSGKNSTPCVERKIDGTIVIEVDFDPTKDMVITCDCVGILKERNVDVEHRFPDQSGSRNKKKSTRCRMVFRTTVTHPDGSTEVLQITSHPIVCTQPPGVPEICKKSLSACPCTGGMELFILGKNFLKDTKVLFQEGELATETSWSEAVLPDKEFLQQTHLVCTVPPFRRRDLTEAVAVRLLVVSSGKSSEPHTFTYTPTLQQPAVPSEGTQSCVALVQSAVSHTGAEVPHVFARSALVPGAGLVMPETGPAPVAPTPVKPSPKKTSYLPMEPAQIGEREVHPVMMWQASPADTPKRDGNALETKALDRVMMSGKIMPPPALLPITSRRPSAPNLHMILPDSNPPPLLADKLKTELAEENSNHSPEDVKGIDLRMKPISAVNPIATVADLLSTQSPTMATFRQFVTGNTNSPLPTQTALSVEKYLSRLEHVRETDGPKVVSNHCKIDTPTVPQIRLNRTAGESLQFNGPSTVFEQQQTTDSGDRKLEFVNNLPLPMMYGTQSGGPECKSRFAPEDASLLQQTNDSRRKSIYDDTLTMTANPDSVLGTRQSMVVMQESQPVQNSVRSLEQSVSSIMDTVADAPTLLQPSGGLLYSNHSRATDPSPMPSQSREGCMMDNLSKGSSSITVPGIVGEPSLLNTPSMQASAILGDQMLSVTQAQSSMIASTQSARLDALVTSAMNSQVLDTNNRMQSSETDKLDALVNSAAASHMISTPSCPQPITIADSVMMSVPVQAPLGQQNISATTDQTSPVPVKKMSLDAPVASDACLGGFDLMSAQQSSRRLSQENAQLMNKLTEQLLSAPSQGQAQADAMAGSQMNIDTCAPTGAGSIIYPSHDRTSPIAMKTMILNSTVTTAAEGQILITSPTRTSPVAVKSMVMGSSDSVAQNQILATGSTPPIAVKKMVPMPVGSPEGQMLVADPTAIKSILNSSIPPSDEGQMIVRSPTRTSPIAMKAMILESAASGNVDACLNTTRTSPIAVKAMIMNSQLSANVGESFDSVTTLPSGHLSAENARLDILVQSSLSHGLISNATQVTSAMDVHAGNGIGVLSSGTHVQQPSQVPVTLHPPVCIASIATQPSEPTSHLSIPVVTTGDALLNTIFATSRSPTAQDHSFHKEASVTVGADAQTPCCTGGSLLHTSQFTTASSTSQSLLTGITMSSKEAEQLAAQSRNNSGFVTEMLLGLAANKVKKDPEMTLVSRGKMTEPLQQQEDFVSSVTENKLPESRLFTSEMLKATLGDATSSHIQPSAMDGHNQRHLATVKSTQESEHCKQPQTTACATGTTPAANPGQPQKKTEEGMVPQELTQMSEHDLLSYINPSTFDQV